MSDLSAIYCHEQRELMLESGRVIIVPEPIARSCSETNDTRFIRAWAIIHNLIPASGQVGFFEAA